MLQRFFASLLTATLLATLPMAAMAESTYGNVPHAAAHVRNHTQAATARSESLTEYTTENAAQRHCPNDTVVWLNTNSGIYHEQGMRWYGRTRHGAYVCRKEADAAGDRDTRNGQ